MVKKKLRNDLLLIVPLLVAAIIALVVILTRKTDKPLVARVYVSDAIVETIDLSDKTERDYTINGKNGELVIHVHDGKIKVSKSNCPHQDCVNQGEVSDINHPIICAYNEVYIVINGNANYDVEI